MVAVTCRSDGMRWVCEVKVDQGRDHTTHTVTVSRTDLDRWAGGRGQEEAEDLVARSFEFLLQREPPGSILRRFDLSVIQSYFPEYDRLFTQ